MHCFCSAFLSNLKKKKKEVKIETFRAERHLAENNLDHCKKEVEEVETPTKLIAQLIRLQEQGREEEGENSNL